MVSLIICHRKFHPLPIAHSIYIPFVHPVLFLPDCAIMSISSLELPGAAAEGHQRLRGDERPAGNGLQRLPQQPGGLDGFYTSPSVFCRFWHSLLRLRFYLLW